MFINLKNIFFIFFTSFALTLNYIYSGNNYDIVIGNGKIVDGSGNPWYEADIGIIGDRIVHIGNLQSHSTAKFIDAKNLIVSPGFIDPHTHAIRGVFDVPNVESSLLQGVTTLTEGNDGSSPFPIDRHFQKILDKKISPNWGVFVGHGTIRSKVVGSEDREPTPNELDQMKDLVKQAMEHGALGLSTGLYYVPGNFASTEEVIELSKVASEHGGIYISHMREEASKVIDSVKETILIGEKGRIPVQITHHKVIGAKNWGLSVESLALVDEARRRGIDITIDQYPYTASQTYLKALVPQWAQEGGRKGLVKRLTDPETRTLIKKQVIQNILFDRGGGDPKNVFISINEWDPSMAGKNLADLVVEKGMEPTPENAAEVVFEIIEGGGAGAVFHAINSDDVDRIMQHPVTAIGSDGPVGKFGVGSPHPRQYGTFARVLGHYVRERGVLELEDAVRKMTSLTSQRLGIRNRGLISEGYFADIAVFDADQIIDKATFEDPHQYATGMKFVLVNGEIVVKDGQHTGKRPGRIIYGPGHKNTN